MLVRHEVDNHVRANLARLPISDGQTERMQFRPARVHCGDSAEWSAVDLTLYTPNPRCSQRAVTLRIETPPATLRAALEGAIRNGFGRVAFAIEDAGRFDVDTDVHLNGYDSRAPVTLMFVAERAALPWPATLPPRVATVPDGRQETCRHSALDWYLKDGKIGCDECDAAAGSLGTA